MTLELAKSRRLEALNQRFGDRILVKPGHHSQLTAPTEGTVADYLLDALCKGCDPAQLQQETGWSKAVVMSNLYKVAKRTGVGIRRSQDALHLILPDGADKIYPRSRVVKTEDATTQDTGFDVIEGTLVN